MKPYIKIESPLDLHVHFRKENILKLVLNHTAKQFSRAIVMPNTTPEIMSYKEAIDYYTEIKKNVFYKHFKPMMTLYFNENMSEEDIIKIKNSKKVYAIKLYLKGVTTNSNKGISNIKNIYSICKYLEKHQVPLLIHGEVTDTSVDIFDRENVFIDKFLEPLIKNFPKMKIVMEHLSTKYAVDFIKSQKKNVCSTITPHHMIIDRNDLLAGGIRPNYYCLPIVKKNKDKEALIEAATSGNKHFFAGTDSAPHSLENKINKCGCAGIFSAYNAIELYTQIFDNENKLKNLQKFISNNGSKFYGIKKTKHKIKLEKHEEDQQNIIPDYIKQNNISINIFKTKMPIYWKMEE